MPLATDSCANSMFHAHHQCGCDFICDVRMLPNLLEIFNSWETIECFDRSIVARTISYCIFYIFVSMATGPSKMNQCNQWDFSDFREAKWFFNIFFVWYFSWEWIMRILRVARIAESSQRVHINIMLHMFLRWLSIRKLAFEMVLFKCGQIQALSAALTTFSHFVWKCLWLALVRNIT